MFTSRFTTVLALGAGLILTVTVQAGDFDLFWHAIDGGGGSSVGGDFEVSGTIGQPDADAVMLGAGFALTGGFWAGAPAGSPCIGDFDHNHQTDLGDFGILEGCLDGPGVSVGQGCDLPDLDADGDADLGDFALFQAAFGCP